MRVLFSSFLPSTLVLFLASCSSTASLAPCGAADPGDGDTELGGVCPIGTQCVEGQCLPPGTDGGMDGAVPGFGTLTGIALEPSDITVTIRNGQPQTRGFVLLGRFGNGETRTLSGTYTSDLPSVGEVHPTSGSYTAFGSAGGEVSIEARVAGSALVARATVTVLLESEFVGDGIHSDGDFQRLFQGPRLGDESRAATVVYPSDGAVVPQNVFPMDIQWLQGEPGDSYRVTLRKPHATVVAYLNHEDTGGLHWLVETNAWRSLAQSDANDDVVVTVDRFEAASEGLIVSPPVRFRFVRAALTGSVYYWDIKAGQIIRILGGTGQREQFMPTPPLDRSETRNCVGCHAVSNNGRYMAGRLGGADNIGAVFDLSADLTGDPPPTVAPISPDSERWWFASWSPDDSRLIVSSHERVGRTLKLLDPYTNQELPISGAFPVDVTQPAWSPDGSAIAYAANINNKGDKFTEGDLGILDVTGPDRFENSRILLEASGMTDAVPGGSTISYPSWTPDSSRILFHHGNSTRSSSAAIYSINRDGSGLVRLDKANGGTETDYSYQPNVTPFDSEEYYWVAFLSRRDYGNAQAGTRGRRIPQVWVSAIRKDATQGVDPSEVAYWLPGQSTASRNISAFWAKRACRDNGDQCSVDSECCGGTCRPDTNGGPLVCGSPPAGECQALNETCSASSDCCGSLECLDNVCISPLI